MPQKRKLWTAEDDADLRRLAESGLPRGEIARRLDRTLGSLEVRASTLGIKMASTYITKLTDTSVPASVRPEETPKLRKYFEALPYGKRTGRVAYAIKLRTLPKAIAGAEWSEDKSFNAAQEILARPSLKTIFKAALQQGCALMTEK
jgi:hypothetical protein